MELPDTELKIFQEECLAQHNYYRKLHNCPPLKLEKHLCSSACFWASQIAKRGALIYSENPDFGQNLFKTANLMISGKDPVCSWYKAIRFFDFNSYRYNPRAYNFMQVVWKSSTDLGVGVALKDNMLWIAAHYRPAITKHRDEILENVSLGQHLKGPFLLERLWELLRYNFIMKALLNLLYELKCFIFG